MINQQLLLAGPMDDTHDVALARMRLAPSEFALSQSSPPPSARATRSWS